MMEIWFKSVLLEKFAYFSLKTVLLKTTSTIDEIRRVKKLNKPLHSKLQNCWAMEQSRSKAFWKVYNTGINFIETQDDLHGRGLSYWYIFAAKLFSRYLELPIGLHI